MDQARTQAGVEALADQGGIVQPFEQRLGGEEARVQRQADGQAVEEVLQAGGLPGIEDTAFLVASGDEEVHERGGLDLVAHRNRLQPPEELPRRLGMGAEAGEVQRDGGPEGAPSAVREEVGVTARGAARVEEHPDAVGAVGGEMAFEGHAVGAHRAGGDHLGLFGPVGKLEAEGNRPVEQGSVQRPGLAPPPQEIAEGPFGGHGMGQAAVVPERGPVQGLDGRRAIHAQPGQQPAAVLFTGEILQKLKPLSAHDAGIPLPILKAYPGAALQQADGGAQAGRPAASNEELAAFSAHPRPPRGGTSRSSSSARRAQRS